jgi:N-acetylglucosamine-6-sulfatase
MWLLREASEARRDRRWTARRSPVTALVLLVAAVASTLVLAPSASATMTPNIVLILTDDQRWDTLWAMPRVQRDLVARGVDFRKAFVVNPVCCPSRSTILTGEYSHSTGVYTNHAREPYGGFPAFDDSVTIATVLSDAGYRTGLFGKYLNGYRTDYVPPGWDRWFATYGNGGYYNYEATDNGVQRSYGSRRADYGTDVLARHAVDFIGHTQDDQPLFLYLATHAPHFPAVPDSGDGNAFARLAPFRPRSYNESNVSDKPAWVRSMPTLTPNKRAAIDAFRVAQCRSLLAVDRAVGSIVDELDATGRLSNTMIVFASDNGFHWGEHRLFGKGSPYEESIRIPLVVRDDAIADSDRVDGQHLALNLDLAPTFADLAGVDLPGAEGSSLVPILKDGHASWRHDFLVEHLNLGGAGAPTFCEVRERDFVYIRYGTGERELYALRSDPRELDNAVARFRGGSIFSRLKRQLRGLCDPPPPGYSL